MTALLPLALFPYPPTERQIDLLRASKLRLCERDGLQFNLVPSRAVPGSPTRVLSFDGPPPFVCDVAKLRNPEDPAELDFWLEWVLDDEIPAERGFTVPEYIVWLLPGAREVVDA